MNHITEFAEVIIDSVFEILGDNVIPVALGVCGLALAAAIFAAF